MKIVTPVLATVGALSIGTVVLLVGASLGYVSGFEDGYTGKDDETYKVFCRSYNRVTLDKCGKELRTNEL